MNRIFRTLLIWLVIAALPIQATAAVVNSSCGSAHHPAQMQDASFGHAPEADTALHAPHHGHSPTAAHHAHVDHAPGHAEFADDLSSGAAHPSASSDQADQGHSTCSACAACCVGAVAPPPAQVKTPEFDRLEKSVIVSSMLVTGFIPPGLERPPRFFPA